MRKGATLFLLCLFPLTALAEVGVTRRDGFLLIWEGITRSVEETREPPFMDIGKDDRGFPEITYAKARGILDDGERFHPEDSLVLSDALLWLFRTRNVADLEDIAPEKLSGLLQQYPIADPASDFQKPLASLEELTALAGTLDASLAEEVHEVSLYSEKFHGKGTAFGETFDMNALTAAHRTFPWNTLVKVTNVENGKSVIVRINDRGPFVEGRDMDLSLGAFTVIAPRSQGIARATFQRLGDASLVDACTGIARSYQRRIIRTVRFDRGMPQSLPLGDTLTLTSTRSFVVRSVTYPDGTVERLESWVIPGEIFSLTPSIPGTYVFRVGTMDGHSREMQMEVWQCGAAER